MQENEFEKQVKRLLEEFNIPPADETWKNISRKLNEKRRRRLPFIFLLALGLGTAGFFIFYKGEKKTIPNIAISKGNNMAAAKNKSLLKDSTNYLQKDNNAGKKINLPSTDKKVTHVLAESNLHKEENVIHYKLSSPRLLNKPPLLTRLNDTVSSYKNRALISDALIKKNKIAFNSEALQQDSTGTSIIKTNDIKQVLVNEDTVAEHKNLLTADTLAASSPDTTKIAGGMVTKIITPGKNAARWRWGINGFYGKSNTVEGLVSSEKSITQYLTSPTNIISGDTIFNRYAYTTSNAYAVGFEVQRKISKSSAIAAGINFTHLSTKSDVRPQVNADYTIGSRDSFTVGNYFQPGNSQTRSNSQTYTNKYNFIELPVYFQQYLLQKKQFAVALNAGLSVRSLLNSNALIYNAAGNIYFSRNELLRKTQVQVLAGLNFNFNTGKTTSIYISPQVSYSLSNTVKNKDYGNFHFISYGIKAGWLLHKK